MSGLDDRPPLYIPAHILERDTRSGLVLFDAGNGRLFRLDAAGARIWRLIEGHGQSLDALARIISDQPREPLERIARDVRSFVEQAVEQGLLAVRTATARAHAASDDEAIPVQIERATVVTRGSLEP